MAMAIIEKGSEGLFGNEIEFNGNYSLIIRQLKDLGIFSTYREGYLLASVIGFSKELKKDLFAEDNVASSSIFAQDLIKRKADLRFVYRLIMLSDNDDSFTIDDYMNRTFKDDSNEEDRTKLRENMRLFHKYTCGGLDYLYGRLKNADTDEKRIETIHTIIEEAMIDADIPIEGEVLPEFFPIIDDED